MFHSYANALEFIEKNGWEREVWTHSYKLI
jgi:hypothetical protein